MSCLHDGYFTLGLDADPEVAETIRGELGRQQNGIELIAPENMVLAPGVEGRLSSQSFSVRNIDHGNGSDYRPSEY